MKNSKTVGMATFIVMMLIALVALVSCETDPSPAKHIHNPSDEWSYDQTEHWQSCRSCEDKFNIGEHTVRPATCLQGATCSVCGAIFGEPTSHKFTVSKSDGSEHWTECEVCNAVTGRTAHSGGVATCTNKAVCTVCNNEYGSYLDHNMTVYKNSENEHWLACSECGIAGEKEAHKGGVATCTNKAVCTVCGFEYGNKENHKLTIRQTDELFHWYKCEDCDAVSEKTAHSGGNATCTDKAVCTVCGKAYGNIGDHQFTNVLCSDETGHWHECVCGEKDSVVSHIPDRAESTETEPVACTECGYVIVPIKNHTVHTAGTAWFSDGSSHWHKCIGCNEKLDTSSHEGGVVSCTEKSVCSVCGAEYGTLSDHSYTVLQSNEAEHWYKCENCNATEARNAHTGGTATCVEKATCTVCGTEYGNLSGHSYTVRQSNEAEHWYKCKNCDDVKYREAHSGGSATCTEKAVCTACGAEYGEYGSHLLVDVCSNETSHWMQCSCGYAASAEAHIPDRAAPTEELPVKCTECGYIIKPQTVIWTGFY